ncbi:MAG: hypothetical protein ACXW30_01200 [Micavibrio sp.]
MTENLEKYGPYAHLLVVMIFGVCFFAYPRYSLPDFLHWTYVGSVTIYALVGMYKISEFFEEKDFKCIRKGGFLLLISAAIVMIELARNAL